MKPTIIRIAVQKSGRLSEDSLSLFKECGIRFESGSGKLRSVAANFPIEFLFLRDDDIPGYVEDGVADLGVVGENVNDEVGRNVEVVRKLGFSKCRLSIAVTRGSDYTGVSWLEGRRIATSYPTILGNFLQASGVRADIHEISGSVEIAPGIGLADAVCDIVSSGSTLLANGLVEVETIFRSEAVLIATPGLSSEKKQLLDKLLFRIEAVQTAKNNKYVVMNVPNEAVASVVAQLPGIKSPTVVPLNTPGWSAVHSVLNEEDFWDRIDALRQAGAQGLLVVPIEKMIY